MLAISHLIKAWRPGWSHILETLTSRNLFFAPLVMVSSAAMLLRWKHAEPSTSVSDDLMAILQWPELDAQELCKNILVSASCWLLLSSRAVLADTEPFSLMIFVQMAPIISAKWRLLDHSLSRKFVRLVLLHLFTMNFFHCHGQNCSGLLIFIASSRCDRIYPGCVSSLPQNSSKYHLCSVSKMIGNSDQHLQHCHCVYDDSCRINW